VTLGRFAAPIVENLVVIGGWDIGINARASPVHTSRSAIIRNIITGGRPRGIEATRNRRVVNNTVFGARIRAYNLEEGSAFNNLAYGSTAGFSNCANQNGFSNNNAFGTINPGGDFDGNCDQFSGNTAVDPNFQISNQGQWDQVIGTDGLRDNEANFIPNSLQGKWMIINRDLIGVQDHIFYIVENTATDIKLLMVGAITQFSSRFGNRNYEIIDWTTEGTGVRDAGNNNEAPSRDIYGNGRPYPLGGTADIGAVEFVAPPEITIANITVTEGEATTQASFTVQLSQPYSQTVQVDYETIEGTALQGQDYQVSSGTLTIPAGQASGVVAVSILGDQISEEVEEFSLSLSGPINSTLVNNSATATITDNDSEPTVGFATNLSNPVESGNSLAISVNLSGASSQNISVQYAITGGTATGGGADYLFQNGTLNFAPNETTQEISLQLVDDQEDESNETILLELSNPINAALVAVQHQIVIQDNDSPTPQPPPPSPPSLPSPPSPPSQPSPSENPEAHILGPHTASNGSKITYQAHALGLQGNGMSYEWQVIGPGTIVGAANESRVEVQMDQTGSLTLNLTIHTNTQYTASQVVHVIQRRYRSDLSQSYQGHIYSANQDGSLVAANIETLDGRDALCFSLTSSIRFCTDQLESDPRIKFQGYRILVCDPNHNELQGRCWVIDKNKFSGTLKVWEETSQVATQSGIEPNQKFGYSVALVDFNGDGFSEVVIHSPGNRSLYFYHPEFFERLIQVEEINPLDLSERAFLVTGDLNGDNHDELVIAQRALRPDVSTGRAFIIPGASNISQLEQTPLMVEGNDPFFSAAIGDVNGDGVDDLLIASLDACEVYGFFGSSNSPPELHVDGADLVIQGESCNQFGYDLVIADLTDDGIDDIAILEKMAGPQNQGHVRIIYGDPLLGGRLNLAENLNHSIIEGTQENGHLGEVIFFAADVNGDGTQEIIASENANGEVRSVILSLLGVPLEANIISNISGDGGAAGSGGGAASGGGGGGCSLNNSTSGSNVIWSLFCILSLVWIYRLRFRIKK